ncbi:phosphatase PAP2 family protein [Agarivorans sp. MS3-6]|uniref:phosphatase PAP2 family protein n=1 Tax=Agarivorans sp. TSD2052 TaxID=2937286 RepID=UPI00200BB109|nr:phosphatase PAP2 family protein [Agarivorans sp. TSD2052]UPW18015.1 phosphatase PAP2 family protein [Agarivorans sp. TSD2052]
MLQRLNRWDYAISATCLGHRFNRQIASMAKVVSHSGDGYYYALLGGAIAFSPFAAPFLSLALPAFALELLAYLLLKQIFRRDRPQSLPVFICPSDRFSFPSGHSAGAFVMAACVAEVFPSWAMLAFCWAGLIAFSRVLLGVHFVSDVIAGACLGLVIVYSLI